MNLIPVTTDLKPFAEAATKLMDVVEKAVGRYFEPRAIVRKAKAEAEAGLILVRGKIEEKELLLRAAERFAYREIRRQRNIEAIVEEAKRALPPTVGPEPVSEDWTTQFFENCKDVGETDMQKLWARILAGEVTKPGTFSRRTLNFLQTCDHKDALSFTAYCSASFSDAGNSHFAFELGATHFYLEEKLGNRNTQNHLVSVGLLVTQNEQVSVREFAVLDINYFEKQCKFWPPYIPFVIETNQTVHVRRFTAVGEELLRVVSARPIEGFIEKLNSELSSVQSKLEEVKAEG